MENKKDIGRPIIYPFRRSGVGDVMPVLCNTRISAIKVRCAAHTLAFNHDFVFRTKIRETDAGKFELTVKRIA